MIAEELRQQVAHPAALGLGYRRPLMRCMSAVRTAPYAPLSSAAARCRTSRWSPEPLPLLRLAGDFFFFFFSAAAAPPSPPSPPSVLCCRKFCCCLSVCLSVCLFLFRKRTTICYPRFRRCQGNDRTKVLALSANINPPWYTMSIPATTGCTSDQYNSRPGLQRSTGVHKCTSTTVVPRSLITSGGAAWSLAGEQSRY